MRAPTLALALLLAGGCTSRRTIGQPNLSVIDATINVRRDVDILFVIDNSPGTAPKQAALTNAFPTLTKRIAELAADGKAASFHVGVVDSDLGAGPFTLDQGQCHPDGDGGQLRACATLPGVSYIDYDSATGTSNLGAGDVAAAFTCLASVGDGGCGFAAPLEAVYRVLTAPSLNPGFLRDDALLVVVVMTAADDCSAPPDSPLFDPSAAGVASYGPLHAFRCTQFGVTCDGMPLDGGALMAHNCAPAPDGLLFGVTRYISLLRDGGVKQSADDVVLATLVAPSTPFDVTVTMPCADELDTPSCPILGHSCAGPPTDPSFFADPAVRINAVAAALPHAVAGSVCDGDYSATMGAVADAMTVRMSGGCLPGAVVDDTDPGCSVTVAGADAPRCDSEGRLPCWELVADPSCAVRLTPGGNAQQLRIAVEGAAPAAALSATCPLYEPSP
jgi:hypothetical protein